MKKASNTFVLGALVLVAVAVAYAWRAGLFVPGSWLNKTGGEMKSTVLAEDPNEPANTVARIGEYRITKEDLEKRLMTEIQPYDYDGYGKTEPTNAKKVLSLMIAEKAIIMEGRKLGFLENEMNYNAAKRFRERKITSLLMQKHLEGNINVTDAEIKARMKADPKLDRVRAKSMVERTKAKAIADEYYAKIYEESNVQKDHSNYIQAAQIHQRLLYRPKEERKVPFIRNSQIRDELTAADKGIVLATFDNGKVTLKDWFETLGEIVPPRRPKNLNTPDGVDELLERTLKTPLLVAEAASLGLDKEENLVEQVKEYEDRIVLGASKQAKFEEVPEPTVERITAFWNENKELFREDRSLNADQIWCADLETAEKVKAELDEGKDFEAVKQKHSVDKEAKAQDIYMNGEGYFWKDLWKGEPNDVLGPLKGFHKNEFKWRIVKVLKKNPGKSEELTDNIKDRVKWKILDDKRSAFLEEYSNELLKKYPYKVYEARIKDIDPLNIP